MWPFKKSNRRRRSVAELLQKPGVETLEVRQLLSATISTVREASGSTPADIQATIDVFRADLGTNNGSSAGSQGSGRREINWDGVPDSAAVPNAFSGDFFNTTSTRGVVLSTPGNGLLVSADSSNETETAPLFANVQNVYQQQFQTFSAQRLFSPVGSHEVTVKFYIAGTTTPAVVSGFGAVFTDVETAGSTKIEYFDASGLLLYTREVLTNVNQGLSFTGVTFSSPVVAEVRITSGSADLGTVEDRMASDADVVVMDDFIYGEPSSIPPTRIAYGAEAGQPPEVRVFDPVEQSLLAHFFAYDSSFRGGVNVAVGDVNGDGTADIITGTGAGAGPHVKVFSGVDYSELTSFFAFDAGFTGGVTVAAGDINGDGHADIIVGQGTGGSQVKIFSGDDLQVLQTFSAFDPAFRGGVNVSTGDVTGDGHLDLVVSAGPGGGPQVKVINGQTFEEESNFFAFDAGFTGGVSVAAGDLNGDGRADIIVAPGQSAGPHVKVFSGLDLNTLSDTIPFGRKYKKGLVVATGDLDGDGTADLIISPKGKKMSGLVAALSSQPGGLVPLLGGRKIFKHKGGNFAIG